MKLRGTSPPPAETDGEASNPGPGDEGLQGFEPVALGADNMRIESIVRRDDDAHGFDVNEKASKKARTQCESDVSAEVQREGAKESSGPDVRRAAARPKTGKEERVDRNENQQKRSRKVWRRG